MTEVKSAVPKQADATVLMNDAVSEPGKWSHDQPKQINEKDVLKNAEGETEMNISTENESKLEDIEKLQDRVRLADEVHPEEAEGYALKDQCAIVAGKAEAQQDDFPKQGTVSALSARQTGDEARPLAPACCIRRY